MSRKRPGTDTPAYHEMMQRLVRTAGRRASTDTAALVLLADLQRLVDDTMTAAVRAQNDGGVSWDEIARTLTPPGVVPSRANARRKYGRKAAA